MNYSKLVGGFLLAFAITAGNAAWAETIRVAIGTQDTTINCATGGLLVRELKLLEKYLPHDGKYKDVTYDIVWKDFTSGAPLTNEMVADKLDIGAMADFPGANNGAAFRKAGKRSIFVSVLEGSTSGSGNAIVVPKDSPVQDVADLKGKTISVPFASTAHGLLLRVVKAQGWEDGRDVQIITQAPEVAASALQSGKIDAHADFVPFGELFPYRGFARKIYDGAESNAPTFHGTLANADYAKKYPEVVVAYLRATLEANRLVAADPEKYSKLIAKVTGIDAAVNYLFHGPLGLQTRDNTWKPEWRQALDTAIKTLSLLKKDDLGLDTANFIDDSYIRAAFKAEGLNYEAQLKNYAQQPLKANDALTGKPIANTKRVAEIWVKGEAKVRHYASPENAFSDLARIEKAGKQVRAIYAQDRSTGIKLFADKAWYATDKSGQLNAFLSHAAANTWAKAQGGRVEDFATASGTTTVAAR